MRMPLPEFTPSFFVTDFSFPFSACYEKRLYQLWVEKNEELLVTKLGQGYLTWTNIQNLRGCHFCPQVYCSAFDGLALYNAGYADYPILPWHASFRDTKNYRDLQF